jgi:Helix-turn-helix domain
VRFSYRMVPEVYQVFWVGMAAGEFIDDAAVAAGSYRKQGSRWLAAAGGVRPRRGRGLKGRCLTLAQREGSRWAGPAAPPYRTIAALLDRSPSTVSRELRRIVDGLGRYRGTDRTLAVALTARIRRPLAELRLVRVVAWCLPGRLDVAGLIRRCYNGRRSAIRGRRCAGSDVGGCRL